MKKILIAAIAMSTFVVHAAEQPNILVIMADDCTFKDLPLYGGENAKTPNIDRLASEGLVFNRAYLSQAICQPCRSALYSGLYPWRNGAAYNHSASKKGLESMPQHLRALGYRVGLAGKLHVTPQSVFPFKRVPGFDDNCVRNPTHPHDVAGITQFMSKKKKPFCLVVCLTEPHVPWVMGDASAYPEDQLKLPPNMADTPLTRRDFASYLAEITYMDGQVGDILKALESTGQADNTMVLFSSEQGSQFPGCKWTCWDTGLHTALIARWPNKIAAGKRTNALVQYVDVVPTLIELAGGEADAASLDGSSFASVLSGKSDTHRTFAYGIHNNIPEGMAYPSRTVFDGTFRYIRNLTPDKLYVQKYLMGYDGVGQLRNQYWAQWVFQSWNNERTGALVTRYMTRPAEELYRTDLDPYELNNLAGDPEYAEALARLSHELDAWMASQGDPGAAADTMEAYQASKAAAK